jgi:deoxyxylulose-5-phosphate synthase
MHAQDPAGQALHCFNTNTTCPFPSSRQQYGTIFSLWKEIGLKYSILPSGHAMAKVVSHQHHTVKAQIYPKPVHVGCVVGKGNVFLQVLQFSPTSIIPSMLRTHISNIYH